MRNRLILISISILLLFMTSCLSFREISKRQSLLSNLSSNQSVPSLVCMDSIYDFGVAGQEDRIVHSFHLSNKGTAPVQILRIDPGCGCVTATSTKSIILPGEAGEVHSVFETQRYEGEVKRTITVYSNDPYQPQMDLVIKGIIKNEIALIPEGVVFGEVEKGDGPTARIRILGLSKDNLAINKIQANEEFFALRLSPVEENKSKGFDLDVTLKPEIPVGVLNDVITLHTSLRKRPKIDIPIWANITGHIRARPKSLSFGAVQKGSELSESITLYNNKGSKFRILRLSCDLPFLHFEPSSLKKESEIILSGTLDESSPAGPVSGQLTVVVDDIDQGSVTIPIHGFIKNREN